MTEDLANLPRPQAVSALFDSPFGSSGAEEKLTSPALRRACQELRERGGLNARLNSESAEPAGFPLLPVLLGSFYPQLLSQWGQGSSP